MPLPGRYGPPPVPPPDPGPTRCPRLRRDRHRFPFQLHRLCPGRGCRRPLCSVEDANAVPRVGGGRNDRRDDRRQRLRREWRRWRRRFGFRHRHNRWWLATHRQRTADWPISLRGGPSAAAPSGATASAAASTRARRREEDEVHGIGRLIVLLERCGARGEVERRDEDAERKGACVHGARQGEHPLRADRGRRLGKDANRPLGAFRLRRGPPCRQNRRAPNLDGVVVPHVSGHAAHQGDDLRLRHSGGERYLSRRVEISGRQERHQGLGPSICEAKPLPTRVGRFAVELLGLTRSGRDGLCSVHDPSMTHRVPVGRTGAALRFILPASILVSPLQRKPSPLAPRAFSQL